MPRSNSRVSGAPPSSQSRPASNKQFWILLKLVALHGIQLPDSVRPLFESAFDDLLAGRIGSLEERLGPYWNQREKRSTAKVRYERPLRVNQTMGQILAERPVLSLSEAFIVCTERLHLSLSTVRRDYYRSLKQGGRNYAAVRSVLIGTELDPEAYLSAKYPPGIVSDVTVTNENDAELGVVQSGSTPHKEIPR